jgi:hypothetical protein
MNEEKSRTERERYLTKFKRKNDVEQFGFSVESATAGQDVINELKKRDLTYDDAYASLQWAYNKLQYESNFINIQ